MRKIDCSICDNKEIALNDTIKIDGKVYCTNCFDANFSDQKELDNKLVEKDLDSTICSFCSKDFGELELNKISAYPICESCEITVKNKTFPTWVKGFFIGIIAIVVVSFIWNWKYYRAYLSIKKSNEFYQNGDFSNASLLMRSASETLPEVEDIKIVSSYFSGIDLLYRDKSAEALMEFEKYKDKMPDDFDINYLIIQARIGASFDNKDYEGFLKASKENLAFDTTLAISLTSVASAYACLYADNGFEEDKQNAVSYLNKAKQIDSTSNEMTVYYNMVEYRIDSRNIIRREEFIEQFPNGWTKN